MKVFSFPVCFLEKLELVSTDLRLDHGDTHEARTLFFILF